MYQNGKRLGERIKVIKAMELIARQINDEEVFINWLTCGVPDGDIPYGDITTDPLDGVLDWWYDDDNYADLMRVFLDCMAAAKKPGGLLSDGVTSK